MPELPEVEHLRRTIEPRLVGRRVVSVEVLRADVCEVWTTVRADAGTTSRQPRRAGDSASVLSPCVRVEAAGEVLARRLLAGTTVIGTQRRGKELALLATAADAVADAPEPSVLCVHLGMSGRLRWHEVLPEFGTKEHVHVLWRLEALGKPAGWMSFADPRRFGGLAALPSPCALAWRWRDTGPDALLTDHAALVSMLTEKLGTTRRMVKAALLDQRVIAGVGNIYADEALFEARIAPQAQGGRLKPAQIEALVAAIQTTLHAALVAGGSTLRDYVSAEGVRGEAQVSHRVYGRAGQPCVRCQTLLRTAQLAQRTTVWCPACQRRAATGPAA